MFRLDFDFEETGVNPKPLFSMDKFLNQIIPEIQKELENSIKDFRNEMTDMVLLTKKPYMKSENVIKHGLHIVAPNLFINKESFKIIEKKILQKLDGYDSTFSNPWLCYGQGKSRQKGFYTANKVLTSKGFILEPHIYFRDYVVYDDNEKNFPLCFLNICFYKCPDKVHYKNYYNSADFFAGGFVPLKQCNCLSFISDPNCSFTCSTPSLIKRSTSGFGPSRSDPSLHI